jgi:hypothetical protein
MPQSSLRGEQLQRRQGPRQLQQTAFRFDHLVGALYDGLAE